MSDLDEWDFPDRAPSPCEHGPSPAAVDVAGFYSSVADRTATFLALPGGSVVTFDAADFDTVSGYAWRIHHRTRSNRRTYVRVQRRIGKGRRVWIWMHRLIMGLSIESVRVVDHFDGDGLNNRRRNLRIALEKQNNRNKRAIHSSTGFKGVTQIGRRFAAYITVNGKRRSLGRFDTAEQAGEAYDRAARKLHGAYAATNADLRQAVAA